RRDSLAALTRNVLVSERGGTIRSRRCTNGGQPGAWSSTAPPRLRPCPKSSLTRAAAIAALLLRPHAEEHRSASIFALATRTIALRCVSKQEAGPKHKATWREPGRPILRDVLALAKAACAKAPQDEVGGRVSLAERSRSRAVRGSLKAT